MLKNIKKLLYCFLLIALFPGISMASSFPDFPMAFWGNATLNENSLVAGTKIRAYCNNDLIGEITMVEDGIYGYDLATKNKLLVSNCEGKIIFKYLLQGTSTDLTGDTEINYTNGFESGGLVKKDLNFTKAVPVTEQSSGGGGGGGGSSSLIPPPVAISLIGDMDGDSKIGVLDFNILMINWGDNPLDTVADLDGNSRVDIFDFNLLMINWA